MKLMIKLRLMARKFRRGVSRILANATQSESLQAELEQEPMRAELLSSEQLAQLAKSLSLLHVIRASKKGDHLLTRLQQNHDILIDVCHLLGDAVTSKESITPAGEWLLDNFYLIEAQVRTAKAHLPRAYSRELPCIANGQTKGQPRIYDLALQAISHGDSHIDAIALERYLSAYQIKAPLLLGELWAFPIMLRLALIENLRRVANRIRAARMNVLAAANWAEQMIAMATEDPKNLLLVIADMARSDPPMVSAFVAELARRLSGQGPSLTLPLNWIEQRLSETDTTISQMILAENQQQASDQLTLSNSIASLRFLGACDWRTFVEKVSLVEHILHHDPAGVYASMDFETRDHYRRVIDLLAKNSRHSEIEIAQKAIDLATQSALSASSRNVCSDTEGTRMAHVGYFLIGEGHDNFRSLIGTRSSIANRIRAIANRSPLFAYLGSITLACAIFSAAMIEQALDIDLKGWWLAAVSLLCILAASQISIAFVNWFSGLLGTPKQLPKMDYSKAIPAHSRTLVVVPSMLTSTATIDALLEAMEVRFLGNRDAQLFFGLLTDFPDAKTESLESDAPLLELARIGVAKLNRKYSSIDANRFFLFHRPRKWNESDHIWMGYERKRGKLSDLNSLLRGHGKERFSCVEGDLAGLTNVRYVITLDTDTVMPRGCAVQLIAAMAHPLNRPQLQINPGDTSSRRVLSGYGILQPRMATSLLGASRYAELCGNEPGIDPYTRSVSDVYQDVFAEGSFIGKGIYDVDAFELTLNNRFPENRILSHDLLEGCYVRSGLISDVQLYESSPISYLSDASRQQRWIRGDWQIARWTFSKVPTGERTSSERDLAQPPKLVRNPLSTLSRWKIFDNLRRSLVAPSMLALLVFGATTERPWFWISAVLAVSVLPALLNCLIELSHWPAHVLAEHQLSTVLGNARANFSLLFFRFACLPFEAFYSLNAIARTLWRLLVSHQGLLEWQLSANTEKVQPSAAPTENLVAKQAVASFPKAAAPDTVALFYRAMWPCTTVAVLLVTYSVFVHIIGVPRKATVHAALVLLALIWCCAPALAWWLGKPPNTQHDEISAGDTNFLRKIARKTWAFFDRFVTAEENWLPPDNYQELPGPIIAHRTSPTNMGMALLANLTAYDFGYINCKVFLQRTEDALLSMSKLEQFNGHFFNWYDTLSLLPQAPRYVSTVDSGNLAGHLLTLRVALVSLENEPLVHENWLKGLLDTFDVMADVIEPSQRDELASLKAVLDKSSDGSHHDTTSVWTCVKAICIESATLLNRVNRSSKPDTWEWTNYFDRQCVALSDELSEILHATTQRSPAMLQLGSAADSPTAQITRYGELVRFGDSQSGAAWATARVAKGNQLAKLIDTMAQQDFAFLYDHSRDLLSIGFDVDEHRRDNGFYDLLASEARLGYFVAIAHGQIPQRAWFSLGRLQTNIGGAPILMSWSGSMFEYLMPVLVMPNYPQTLLAQTCLAAVVRQIDFGRERDLPWGVSESGYSAIDRQLNYQYRAFGVPGLGLKRGLGLDVVIAPYASALALTVMPNAACANLQRLAQIGMEGRYGFFEAIDYTPNRVLRGQTGEIVQSFMAHHQGMSLLSIAHCLLNQPMQRRFTADAAVQSTLLLLQERIPKHAVFHQRIDDPTENRAVLDSAQSISSFGAYTATPQVQLLSNGHFQTMLTNSGSGYSRLRDIALTRWREDSCEERWGNFLYLRDVANGEFWSATHQPTCVRADSYEANFSEGRAEYRRRDFGIESYCEVAVSPEDNLEIRRLRLNNRSSRSRTIEVTSYLEVVIAPIAEEIAQPGFSNLFVETHILAAQHAIISSRRSRSHSEAPGWLFHLLAAQDEVLGHASFETDRMRFIGRGRSLRSPLAMQSTGPLSGTEGAVLDPINAIRVSVQLDPGQNVCIDFVTGIAESRDACDRLVEKHQDRLRADRCFELALTHANVALRQINVSSNEAELYRQLAGDMIFASARLRAEQFILLENNRNQSGLWGYSISGDLPILLLKIADSANIELARLVIQCHSYWRQKGLIVDLVIWNEDQVSYRQRLQDQIMGLVTNGFEGTVMDRPGGIFVRMGEQISAKDRTLLQAVARVILSDDAGTFEAQVKRGIVREKRMAKLAPKRRPHVPTEPIASKPSDLQFPNHLGGFSPDASEYIIQSSPSLMPPLPWVNVLANQSFGSVVTDRGLAYTWFQNAHEYRLTPWSDDVIGAGSGEALYLRDEESGQIWSPAPGPCPSNAPHRIRHGFGYSVFEHSFAGVHSELWIYVDLTLSVKYSVLKLRNTSGRTRSLSAFGYVQWVLGDLSAKTAMHVVTTVDSKSGALMARNSYSNEFSGAVAFFDAEHSKRSFTCDRAEFIGRNGSLQSPDALSRVRLSGKCGAGLDPCCAIQVPIMLAAHEEQSIVFRLGAAPDLAQASALALSLRRRGSAETALSDLRQYWRQTLGAVQVQTPDPALNVLANGWLIYQTMSSRLWGRSGFYQSGGAFGFRDQLQDVVALMHADLSLARSHLLLAAERQYQEGDVQHWWHPPFGRGVRTHCSDDLLWLVYTTLRYVRHSGDSSVLDEPLGFLRGKALGAEIDSYYDLPERSSESATLYQHCVRAINHALNFGAHGLPLMGSGDWNDGMNLVGIKGKGESVWLGFFLHRLLRDFADLAALRTDSEFSNHCTQQASLLSSNLETHAWDGDWYRRAFFDDGTPLGSVNNTACSIDSIAQSWAVLSGGATPARCDRAMHSLDRLLVDRKAKLVKLLFPPFLGAIGAPTDDPATASEPHPGYIAGYLPGVRENGGQYTHAAIWAAMAFAKLGDSARAWELLQMINPINHALNEQAVGIYGVEPYVVAADVYAVEPHVGRGGWTWYTGSAGWLYRLMIESLLGISREGDWLYIRPCIPEHWNHYQMQYRFGKTIYQIHVTQTKRSASEAAVAPRHTNPTIYSTHWPVTPTNQALPGLETATNEIIVRLNGQLQDQPGVLLVDDSSQPIIEVWVLRGATREN